MSSGLYDLITVAASLVQNTWDRSAPLRWEKGTVTAPQLDYYSLSYLSEEAWWELLLTTFSAEIAAKYGAPV